MNKIRRKNLEQLIEQLEVVRSTLDDLKGEEEECLLNLPENLMGSDRYQSMDDAVDALDEALDEIENAIGDIQTAIES